MELDPPIGSAVPTQPGPEQALRAKVEREAFYWGCWFPLGAALLGFPLLFVVFIYLRAL